MNCETFAPEIDDYVDGTLPAAGAAAVEGHLAACPACRALADDFAAIRSLARTLEPQVPSAQVWHRIAAATTPAARRDTLLGIPLLGWRHAAATATVALLAVGLWWVGGRLSPEGAPAAFGVVEPFAPAAAIDAATEDHYATAIARLEAVATDGRDLLDVQTVVALDAGMTVIDEAIDESRAELASQPQSELAQGSLLQALRNKVTLLQATMTLITQMRNHAGEAAGIVAESNR